MAARNKIAFIGLGRISDAHLDGLRRYNDAFPDKALRLAAVIDRFPGRAVEWCDRHFARSASESRPHILEDYAALLEPSNRPDAVSILLPHHLHLEVARPFLEAGIAVQMQKPLGLAMRDGRQLCELAERTGTPMVVSEPAVLGRRTRRELSFLQSGRIVGQPTFAIDQAVIDLGGGFFMTPWRHLMGMAGAGWFIDHGVHRTHWMIEAFGPCQTAYAQTRQIEPARQSKHWGRLAVDTEDLAAAILRFSSGLICQWSVVSGGRGESHHLVQVWATHGSYRAGKYTPSGQQEPRDLTANDRDIPDFPAIPEDPFAHSYQELVQRMEGATSGIIGQPRRALEAEAIVYACLESAHTGKPVQVADVLDGSATEYEATVWSARDRITSMDMNKLT